MTRIRQTLMALLAAVLLFGTSGCGALLLLGIGGAGGYLIKKGEGEDRRSNSTIEEVDRKHAANANVGSNG